ncbi:MAG: thiamine pyrophosphate-dependent enzyme [Chloroflexia bacterium]
MSQPATTPPNGAHLLLATLQARGTRHLFGVPGHGAYPIYDALCDFPAIEPVVGRHEQSSLFSALAFSWASGTTVVATSVPEAGLTNAATGLLEANNTQARLFFVIEANPLHAGVAHSVARHYRRVDTSDALVPAIHALLDQLEFSRPGAAILEVASNVLTDPVTGAPSAPYQRPTPPPIADSEIAAAARTLAGAQRCVILAGATAVAADAGASVQRLAEALHAPVFVDGIAKGILPEDHPLALGRNWSPSGPGDQLLREADVALVIGAPLGGGQVTAPWDPQMARSPRQAILVDWDDSEQAPLASDLRLRGHVPSILAALADAVGESTQATGFPAARLDEVRRWAWDYAETRVPWALGFFQGICAAMPRDGIILLDSMVGLWLDRLYAAPDPAAIRMPFGTGTLGFGVPAAVGAKMAQPGREVVVVAGDGAFLYNPQELATMLLRGQKLTIIIANDGIYGAIKHNMAERFGRATAYTLANPDFVRLGEAFGMRALRLASSDEIGPALAAALAGDQSTLIEVPLELRPPRDFYA